MMSDDGDAVAAEDAVRAEAHAGRDARDAAAVGADDAGHVRAVAVAVVRVGVGHRDQLICGAAGVVGVTDEVPTGDDARGREGRAAG